MGYAMVDNRASGGILKEYNTTTCGHNNEIIVYASKPIDGFLRKVRTSINKYGQRVDEIGTGFFCHKCGKDICHWCGEIATKGGSSGPCRTMERVAYETGNALAKNIDVWSKQGQLYLENLIVKTQYKGV